MLLGLSPRQSGSGVPRGSSCARAWPIAGRVLCLASSPALVPRVGRTSGALRVGGGHRACRTCWCPPSSGLASRWWRSRACARENGPSGLPTELRDPLQFDASSFGFLPDTNPTSPDFVPNEFASGVVLDREGHIVTNYHVLGDPEQNDYFVWVQRRPFKVAQVEVPQEVKAGDPWTDLAVLKIAASDLEPMPLGDASKLRKGMIVIALGNPYGIARDGEVSASWGIISNLRRATAPDPQSAGSGAERSTLEAVRHVDPDRCAAGSGHQWRCAGESAR